MFGEIGVIFNIPQPFTVRTKRLSQVVRISHHHFKQLVQPLHEDGKIIHTNFIQVHYTLIFSRNSYYLRKSISLMKKIRINEKNDFLR